MHADLRKPAAERIAAERENLTGRLIRFAETDTLLFLAGCVREDTARLAESRIRQANVLLNTDYSPLKGLTEAAAGEQRGAKLATYLNRQDDVSFAVIYMVATELKSVLSGVLLAAGKISAEEAFTLAFAEELEQQEKWGKDEDTVKRQDDILQSLREWKRFGDERDVLKN